MLITISPDKLSQKTELADLVLTKESRSDMDFSGESTEWHFSAQTQQHKGAGGGEGVLSPLWVSQGECGSHLVRPGDNRVPDGLKLGSIMEELAHQTSPGGLLCHLTST